MKTIYSLLIIVIFLSVQHLHAQTTDNSLKSANTVELEEYPILSEQVLNAEIILTEEGKKIKLTDYKNDLVIFSLMTDWALLARPLISDLNKLHAENFRDLKIIAVSVENSENEILNFKKFVEMSKIEFQAGWIDKNFTEKLLEISKFHGIPQTFVIKNGKIRGIFKEYSRETSESLMSLVKKISAEEN